MKALDLFCGAGGAGLAMRQIGFQVTGIDCDPDAVAIYRQAVGDAILADVRNLDPRRFGPINLLWASPPCQPWSEARRAQRRLSKFDHPDGKLLLEPVRWAQELVPDWTIVENVGGIPDDALSYLIAALANLYPSVTLLRLNASGWVPQKRDHVFVIAGPQQVPAPAPPPRQPRLREIADSSGVPVEARHLRYALSKRAFLVPVVTLDDQLPTVTTRSFAERWTCFVVERPGVIRFPSFREAARAQGFPDNHPLHNLEKERPAVAWRLLGNAVPVPLARAVLKAVVHSFGVEGLKEDGK